MTPRLVPFRAEHVMLFKNRDGVPADTAKNALIKERDGIAFTGLYNGKIIGCAGIVIPLPHLGLAWSVLSEDVKPHMIWLTRVVRAVIRDAIRVHELRRLEMVALADNARNQRWAEFLGFSRETDGLARNYIAKGIDMIRYEMVL